MPAITIDGQAFSLDGRRLWLVSGSVPYARIPRGLWGDRLRAARQAGLNCVETPVVWSLHEPRAGHFLFEGDLDLTAFVRAAQEHELLVMLRVGPYVGGGYDLGGLPSWLLGPAGGKLRSSAVEFMQPASRWLSAVCDRVRDLQLTSGKKGRGPIVAVQSEHQWCCGDSAQGESYLRELDRYLRENGITVPILGANNLYHSVEGQVDVWTSGRHLHENLRQLRAVKPDQPRIMMGLGLSEGAVWGKKPAAAMGGRVGIRRLAEVLAAGGQYNISPFAGGTSLGFGGGRLDDDADAFIATSPDPDSPLGEGGERGALYAHVRRISTFASQFGRVLSSLDPGYQPAVLSLEPRGHLGDGGRAGEGGRGPKREGMLSGCVAVECRGTQGNVVFVFGPEEGGGGHATIVLSDGSTLPVELGEQGLAWVLLGTFLLGRATLDYCSLNAFGVVGNAFVCFGAAGTHGVVSINGSAVELSVPSGSTATIERHQDVTIVVCNESLIDATYLGAEAVYVGASGIDAGGRPVAHKDYKRVMVIAGGDGSVTHATGAAAARGPRASFGAWSAVGSEEYVRGTSDRFAAIDGPAAMQDLGSGSGYGWLRLKLKGSAGSGAGKPVKAGFFEAADRLHLFADGAACGVFGRGPGAERGLVPLSLKGKESTLSVLVDNLGRTSAGSGLGESKGLYGHVWQASVLKVGAPKIESSDPLEPLAFRTPIMGLEDGDVTDVRRLTWRVQHRRKTPIAMLIDGFAGPGLVVLNGEPIHVLSRGAWERILLRPEQLSKATSVIQIALVGDMEAAAKVLKGAVTFYECEASLTGKASWAFAKWEAPAASKFKALGKTAGGGVAAASLKGTPAWWKSSLMVEGEAAVSGALYLELNGLTKGQVFLNGRNLGRYFVATGEHRAVPPQTRMYLPEPWLKGGAVNEVLIFDEHGASPEKARVVG